MVYQNSNYQLLHELGLTCNLDVVCSDHVAPAVHAAIPGPRVPCLQAAHPEAVGGRVQANAGWVYEGRGPQLRRVHRHPRVLDSRQGGAGPEGGVMRDMAISDALYCCIKKKNFIVGVSRNVDQ